MIHGYAFTRFLRLLTAIAILAAGCTDSSDEYRRIHYACWGTPEQERAARALVDAFEERYPHIRVDVSVMGYGQYFNKIQTMMVGNVAPDVFMIGVNYYDEWASRGVLLDLSSEFEDLQREAAIMPVPRNAVKRGSRVFGLPITVMGEVTFANLDALREAGVDIPDDEGVTWEWMVEQAPRLSRLSGNPDAPTDYAFPVQQPFVFLRQWGVELFDDPYHPSRTAIDHDAAVRAIEFLRMVYSEGYTIPPDVGRDVGANLLFRDGRLAFTFGTYMLTALFEHEVDFEWDVLPFPAGKVSSQAMLGSVSLAVWEGTRNEEAARKFAHFAASPEGARINMGRLRTLPVYHEIAYGEEFLGMSPPDSMVRFSDAMREGRAAPHLYAPGSQQVSRIVNDRLTEAIIRPDIPPGKIARGIDMDLDRWLDRMRRQGIF